MIRPLTLVTLFAAAGAGLYLYQVKHSVSQLDQELREVNRRTEQARERTQVLRAEWALLNEPDRLRRVAQRHLQIEPMTPAQFMRLSEVERRLPAPLAFAGTPSIFAPIEPAGDGRATAIAIASAPSPTPPAAPVQPAPAALAAAPPPAEAAPAPALAAAPATDAVAVSAAAAVVAVAAPRAEPPAAPARVAPVRAAAPRPAPAAARPAVHVQRAPAPASPQGVSAPVVRTTAVSALGGSGLALAPPVPISRAAAATLPGSGTR